jgi:hypothetical protein
MLFNAGYAGHLLLQKVNISLIGLHKSRRQITRAAKFVTVAPNICESSVWNLLQITPLWPRILR